MGFWQYREHRPRFFFISRSWSGRHNVAVGLGGVACGGFSDKNSRVQYEDIRKILCRRLTVPGTVVDLMTAVFPSLTSGNTPRKILSSNPSGVVGVGTAINLSHSFIFSYSPVRFFKEKRVTQKPRARSAA